VLAHVSQIPFIVRWIVRWKILPGTSTALSMLFRISSPRDQEEKE
jgi:hypothetical protein